VPLLYEFDSNYRPIKQAGAMDGLSGRYVAEDLAKIAAEIQAVANQAKAKK
jgi:hypothetical protein